VSTHGHCYEWLESCNVLTPTSIYHVVRCVVFLDCMITSTIYGTLNVPAKPPIASSRSLQWTPDGQLLVLGETIIYILVNVSTHASELFSRATYRRLRLVWNLTERITSQRPSPTFTGQLQPFLCLRQSCIGLEFHKVHSPVSTILERQALIHCVEWSAICIGGIDFSWQAVTHSPTNYSSVGRYVYFYIP